MFQADLYRFWYPVMACQLHRYQLLFLLLIPSIVFEFLHNFCQGDLCLECRGDLLLSDYLSTFCIVDGQNPCRTVCLCIYFFLKQLFLLSQKSDDLHSDPCLKHGYIHMYSYYFLLFPAERCPEMKPDAVLYVIGSC